MWEPWVATLNEQVVEARRTGNGPFVATCGVRPAVPIGRTRRREPLLQSLVRRH
jgi:hypothetical protein